MRYIACFRNIREEISFKIHVAQREHNGEVESTMNRRCLNVVCILGGTGEGGGSYECLFVLRFYGPVNPMGHVERGQFSQPHFYSADLVLCAVTQYLAYSFIRNRQLPFLNQLKGENDHRKYFMLKSMIKSPRKNVTYECRFDLVFPSTSQTELKLTILVLITTAADDILIFVRSKYGLTFHVHRLPSRRLT